MQPLASNHPKSSTTRLGSFPARTPQIAGMGRRRPRPRHLSAAPRNHGRTQSARRHSRAPSCRSRRAGPRREADRALPAAARPHFGSRRPAGGEQRPLRSGADSRITAGRSAAPIGRTQRERLALHRAHHIDRTRGEAPRGRFRPTRVTAPRCGSGVLSLIVARLGARGFRGSQLPHRAGAFREEPLVSTATAAAAPASSLSRIPHRAPRGSTSSAPPGASPPTGRATSIGPTGDLARPLPGRGADR